LYVICLNTFAIPHFYDEVAIQCILNKWAYFKFTVILNTLQLKI